MLDPTLTHGSPIPPFWGGQKFRTPLPAKSYEVTISLLREPAWELPNLPLLSLPKAPPKQGPFGFQVYSSYILPNSWWGNFVSSNPNNLGIFILRFPSSKKETSSWPRYCKLPWPAAPGTDIFIGKMVGKPLGWGPLNNQPHVHLILRGYFWGISPFKELLAAPCQGYYNFTYDISGEHSTTVSIYLPQMMVQWVFYRKYLAQKARSKKGVPSKIWQRWVPKFEVPGNQHQVAIGMFQQLRFKVYSP